MKFTLPWLKEHLETDALGRDHRKLTMIGSRSKTSTTKPACSSRSSLHP